MNDTTSGYKHDQSTKVLHQNENVLMLDCSMLKSILPIKFKL